MMTRDENRPIVNVTWVSSRRDVYLLHGVVDPIVHGGLDTANVEFLLILRGGTRDAYNANKAALLTVPVLIYAIRVVGRDGESQPWTRDTIGR